MGIAEVFQAGGELLGWWFETFKSSAGDETASDSGGDGQDTGDFLESSGDATDGPETRDDRDDDMNDGTPTG